jgi:hypothetical protein
MTKFLNLSIKFTDSLRKVELNVELHLDYIN